jgi:hypothetical protein
LSQFPSLTEGFMRKRIKHCADLQVWKSPSLLENPSFFLSLQMSGRKFQKWWFCIQWWGFFLAVWVTL